jgi:hypothetical protein
MLWSTFSTTDKSLFDSWYGKETFLISKYPTDFLLLSGARIISWGLKWAQSEADYYL